MMMMMMMMITLLLLMMMMMFALKNSWIGDDEPLFAQLKAERYTVHYCMLPPVILKRYLCIDVSTNSGIVVV